MRDYLKNAPYDGELTAAAWRIAGFDGARYFLEDDTRRQQRYRNETVILATTYEPDLSSWREALQPLTRFYRTLLDGTFASLKAGTEPQAWHFLQLDRALLVQREPDSLETPYRVSRRAAQTVLTDLLANTIAGGVTNDALGSLFVGDLVQAVATPLWDVVLPLDIVDLASARSFIARQTLQRTPLQWARLDDMPERSPQLTTSAPAVSGSEMPSSGIGAVTSLSIPLPPTPSWQAMDSATVFVTLPVSGPPSVYVRPAVGFH